MPNYPYLPWYFDSYIADTRHLTAAQHGAYLLLMGTAWRSHGCAIPDDDRFLAANAAMDIRTWKRNKEVVMSFWELGEDHKWRQKRLSDEHSKASKLAESRSRSGKLGAEHRWHPPSPAPARDDLQQKIRVSTPPTDSNNASPIPANGLINNETEIAEPSICNGTAYGKSMPSIPYRNTAEEKTSTPVRDSSSTEPPKPPNGVLEIPKNGNGSVAPVAAIIPEGAFRDFQATFVGEFPDPGTRLAFQEVIRTKEDLKTLQVNTPLWMNTPKYQSGRSCNAEQFLRKGIWKHAPHDSLIQPTDKQHGPVPFVHKDPPNLVTGAMLRKIEAERAKKMAEDEIEWERRFGNGGTA